jgi:hypothetical protein
VFVDSPRTVLCRTFIVLLDHVLGLRRELKRVDGRLVDSERILRPKVLRRHGHSTRHEQSHGNELHRAFFLS